MVALGIKAILVTAEIIFKEFFESSIKVKLLNKVLPSAYESEMINFA